MAVRIYRYRPPEITVTLTAGGTLAASTTYYIAGFFSKYWIYNDVESVFSNVASFTTDTTNKSISVAWKVTVPIQSFTNGGTNRIRVHATNHCLTGGNTLIIESGTYAGTYTVTTWEDYNTFLITGTYSVDETSTFRVETMHNAMNSIIFYMHTVTPFSGDPTLGTWQGTANKMSSYPWLNTYTTTPIAFTAPFTTQKYGHNAQIQGMYYSPPAWCKIMEKGTIWIAPSETATVAEIKQALINADVLDVGYVSGNNDTLTFWGILQSTGTLTFTDMTINCYLGMISGTDATKLTYTRCSVNAIQTTYSYFFATSTYTNFLYNIIGFVSTNPQLAPYSYSKGSNNSFNSPLGLAFENMGANNTIDGMTLTCNSGVWKFDCRYKTNIYTNCTLNKGILYLYYIIESTADTAWRMFDGWYIDSALAYDFNVQYNNTLNFFNLRNINTSRTNNRKVVYTTYNAPTYTHVTTLYFYRGGTMTVKDVNGDAISGATVTLADAGTTASYTTNASGEAVFEVLEQKSVPPTSGYYFTETYYDNWTLTVAKDGYETYMSECVLASDIELEVTLKTAIKERETEDGEILSVENPEMGSSARLLEL